MPVTDEPRVRRQAQALIKAGYKVVVAGGRGRSAVPDGWILKEYPFDEFGNFFEDTKTDKNGTNLVESFTRVFPVRVQTFIRKVLRQHKKIKRLRWLHSLVLSRWSTRHALEYYWGAFNFGQIHAFVVATIQDNAGLKPDFIVGHDYYTLPLAKVLADEYGCRFSMDLHEYAYGQYMHNPLWRALKRPWVGRLQREFLKESAVNTAVSDGIADLIPIDNPGASRPLTIRSTPQFVKMEFRPAGDRIRILYHGLIDRTRGLDTILSAMPHLRDEYDLIIRGSGPHEYCQELSARAEAMGISSRVFIEPPVLFNQIIPQANQADIGYFVHVDTSPQKRFTLPNKFFEYMMAGLALCVSDLPEMSALVKRYDCGVLVKTPSVESVISALNKFTRDDVNKYKNNSLQAAEILCWENESENMINEFRAHIDSDKLRKAV